MISNLPATSVDQTQQKLSTATQPAASLEDHFNDILSQLTQAADEQTKLVEAAEKSLAGQLQDLYKAGNNALHDPGAVQWVNPGADVTSAPEPKTAATVAGNDTKDNDITVDNMTGNDTASPPADIAGVDTPPNYVSSLYSKSSEIGNLMKRLFEATG